MKRGRKPQENGGLTKLVERFPHHMAGRPVLYAVGFDDGRIKFGKCFAPRARLRRLCVVNSARMVWAHLFGPIRDASGTGRTARAEDVAIGMALTVGKRSGGSHRSEYFAGLSKEQAIAFGREARRIDRLEATEQAA